MFLQVLLLSAPAPYANPILDWNAVMMGAIRMENSGPTLSTRNLTILHLSMYDAVQAVARTCQPYRFQPEPAPDTSLEAAAVGAGYEVLKVLYPSARARADEAFDLWESRVTDPTGVSEGLTLGTAVARQVIQLRSADGSQTQVPYIPSNEPGAWRRTPPFFRPPLDPHWRHVRPFAIPDIDSFLPPPPPPLDSPEYAADWEEVRQLGAQFSPIRTAEQSLIAVFWSDFSYTAMPPGHWHEIAAGIARSAETPMVDCARLFALLSLAQADAAIVCWETKFRHNLWRPVTAIQQADRDGNEATPADPTWNHYLASPPFPAYTSGHSTFSKASAEVLALFYGTDSLTFTASSDSLPGVVRTYHSLADCADEVGRSRIYGGIHYEFDNREGKSSGARIAQFIMRHCLLPSESLPHLALERPAPGGLHLRLHGWPNQTLILEASSNLQHWQTISTHTGILGGVPVLATPGPEGHAFFRLQAGTP